MTQQAPHPQDQDNDPGQDQDRRGRDDRRRRDLPLWHPRRLQGRRRRNRRAEEDGASYLVDGASWPVSLMSAALLVLTLVDGLITVALLDQGCEEANPVMRVLLDRGLGAFFVGKFVLTAAFLPVAVVAYRYRLFGTRLRVGHVIPIVVALYLVLIAYQATLWERRRDFEPGVEAAAGGRGGRPGAVASVRGARP
jgi:hypothetical protein